METIERWYRSFVTSPLPFQPRSPPLLRHSCARTIASMCSSAMPWSAPSPASQCCVSSASSRRMRCHSRCSNRIVSTTRTIAPTATCANEQANRENDEVAAVPTADVPLASRPISPRSQSGSLPPRLAKRPIRNKTRPSLTSYQRTCPTILGAAVMRQEITFLQATSTADIVLL